MAIRQVKQLAEQTKLNPLLVTTYVNPQIGTRLRQEQINYIDTAGNTNLRGHQMYVQIQGQRIAEPAEKKRPLGRKGLQLAALFLAHPNFINRTARELAKDAGVALGTVPGTLQELEARGFLRRKGPKEYELRDTERLLEVWVQGYTDLQRPRLLQRRYRLAPGIDLQQLPPALKHAGTQYILVGGEAAAAAYTQYLRPAGATLHLMHDAVQLPPQLVLPDARGNVDVLQGFGAPEHWQGPIDGYIHPLLVYGELLAIGGHDRRLAETAENLREKYKLGVVDQPNA